MEEHTINWDEKNLALTMKIRNDFPELLKFLDEMPNTFQNKSFPENENEEQRIYYESLTSLLNNYVLETAKKHVDDSIARTPRFNTKIAVNGHELCYCENGPELGPTLIFIHGFPFNQTMWHNQVVALQKNYRVLTYDLRGFGSSSAGEDEFSIDLFAEDLICFMDALQIKKAIICGLSIGGYIAMNAIEKYLNRFEALILCDTQCIFDTPEVKENRFLAIEVIQNKGIEKFANDTIKMLFAKESYFTKVSEINTIRQMIFSNSKEVIINTLMALANRKETCSKLQHVQIPVLILVGSEDRLTPTDAAAYMNAKLFDSKMIVIEQSGHLSNIENPEQFNNELKKFLYKFAPQLI